MQDVRTSLTTHVAFKFITVCSYIKITKQPHPYTKYHKQPHQYIKCYKNHIHIPDVTNIYSCVLLVAQIKVKTSKF